MILSIKAGLTYPQIVVQIGEHWTFYMGGVRILVKVDLAGGESVSGDEYFNAKYTAQACYLRLFGQYPNRSDICSSPIENRKRFTQEKSPSVCFIATQEDREAVL
jgi:hypothetical protein